MRTRPAWLSYAAKIKSKINGLPRTKRSQGGRDHAIYRSFMVARKQHRYLGTLGDWEFILNETESN